MPTSTHIALTVGFLSHHPEDWFSALSSRIVTIHCLIKLPWEFSYIYIYIYLNVNNKLPCVCEDNASLFCTFLNKIIQHCTWLVKSRLYFVISSQILVVFISKYAYHILPIISISSYYVRLKRAGGLFLIVEIVIEIQCINKTKTITVLSNAHLCVSGSL